MLPHYTDPCTEKYTLDFAMNSFEKVGVVINIIIFIRNIAFGSKVCEFFGVDNST